MDLLLKKLLYICLSVILLISLVGCSNKDELEESKTENKEEGQNVKLIGSVNGLPVGKDNYYVESIYGKIKLDNGSFSTDLNELAEEKTELVLFFVKNESGEIVMMARAKDDVDKGVKIDSESTAIALVLMHPFFSLLPEEEYDEMVELIKGVSSFFVLKENIQTITNVGGNLLSENCIAIQIALESVFEELQQLLDKNENIQSNSRSFSGPEGVYVDCDPLDIKAERNNLAIRVKGLAPTYNGVMINSQKEVIDEFAIPTRDDYGFLDLFNKTVENWQYGETVYTQIPADGEFKFTFKVDVGNLLAYMVSYGIDMLGGSKILKKQFGIDTNKLTEFLYDRFVSYLSAQTAPGAMTVLSYTEIVWGGLCDYLKNEFTLKSEHKINTIALAQTIATVSNFYFKAKTIGNFAGRIMGWFTADKNVEFTLCCYDNEISNCGEPEAVDLGLSIRWANSNLGATFPQDYGDYYAYGEVAPKASYSWENWNCPEVLKLLGDNDAATYQLGSGWRMPTKEEVTELLRECSWTLTTIGTSVGYRVVGKTGNSIFLPLTGAWSSDPSEQYSNYEARYRTSDAYLDGAIEGLRDPSTVVLELQLDFSDTEIDSASGWTGHPIRPVLLNIVGQWVSDDQSSCYYNFEPEGKGTYSEQFIGDVLRTNFEWESFGNYLYLSKTAPQGNIEREGFLIKWINIDEIEIAKIENDITNQQRYHRIKE